MTDSEEIRFLSHIPIGITYCESNLKRCDRNAFNIDVSIRQTKATNTGVADGVANPALMPRQGIGTGIKSTPHPTLAYSNSS